MLSVLHSQWHACCCTGDFRHQQAWYWPLKPEYSPSPASEELRCFHFTCHNDIMTWKSFPHYWPFVGGNPPVTSGFPKQRAGNGKLSFPINGPLCGIHWSSLAVSPYQQCGALMFSLLLARQNKLLNKQICCLWFEMHDANVMSL